MRVEVRNLRIGFPTEQGMLHAVRGVSFAIGQEKVGIVGESGSGKSLTARSILKLLPRHAQMSADRLTFNDEDVLRASERTMRRIRGRDIGLVLQDPKFSLNPVMTVGHQIAETWRVHHDGSKSNARRKALDLLAQVQIRNPERVAAAYAHQLSGGMGQRVMIALVLAPNPKLLIADEPTSALDATVQAEILRLIDDLVSRLGMALLLISHDLPLVSHFCDRVLVMYSGRIVEDLRAGDLRQAKHPYSRGLLACVPSLVNPRPRLTVLARDPEWDSEWAAQ
jgi:peptide/nickel transport system ATP-binding protein